MRDLSITEFWRGFFYLSIEVAVKNREWSIFELDVFGYAMTGYLGCNCCSF